MIPRSSPSRSQSESATAIAMSSRESASPIQPMSVNRSPPRGTHGLRAARPCEGVGCTGVHDASPDHDDDVVSEPPHLLEVVRHPEHRHADDTERAGKVLEREAGGRIDRRRDLVHEHDVGLRHERAREAHPLRFTARERARVPLEERRFEPDALEREAVPRAR